MDLSESPDFAVERPPFVHHSSVKAGNSGHIMGENQPLAAVEEDHCLLPCRLIAASAPQMQPQPKAVVLRSLVGA